MVKPALSYLDMISEVKQRSHLPVAAYSVSGEYAMVKAAAQTAGSTKKRSSVRWLVSITVPERRFYLTYYAKELAGYMDEGRIG